MFLPFVLPLLSSLITKSCASRIKHLVAFGDSYTDQSRLTFFNSNNSFPPPNYQPVYPPFAAAADGGASWVRYAEIYANTNNFNYAVAGAACSNKLTPRPGVGPKVFPIGPGDFPAVDDYEIPTFKSDHVKTVNGRPVNQLNAAETVYSIWIGTNDVGFGALLTGNQTAGVTIVDVTTCVIDWMQTLYNLGARKFLIQNMIPLELTPLYRGFDPSPLTRFWTFPHNATEFAIEMQGLVAAGNALWDLQVPVAISKLKGATAAVFNSHQLFTDMFNHPSRFLNGSLPLNITGTVSTTDIIGNTDPPAPNPDSFLWFDALHPSEQASRIVAREIAKTLNGTGSQYSTFFGGQGF